MNAVTKTLLVVSVVAVVAVAAPEVVLVVVVVVVIVIIMSLYNIHKPEHPISVALNVSSLRKGSLKYTVSQSDQSSEDSVSLTWCPLWELFLPSRHKTRTVTHTFYSVSVVTCLEST